MRGYDLVVVGEGLAPCLVSLSILADRPATRLAQLSTDNEIAGDQLELVLADRLPSLLAELLAPTVTLEWPVCLMRANEQTIVIEERVWLIDPVQVWLEMSNRLDAHALHAGCADLGIEGGTVTWRGGAVVAEEIVDLRRLGGPRRQSEIVEAGVFAELPYPVLADFDGGGRHWLYLQYVPLGSGRALINHIGNAATGRVNPSPPAAMPVDDLPTIAAMTRLGEICAARSISHRLQAGVVPSAAG